MTGADLVVVWNGGELLPPRAERTALPILRDHEADLYDLRADRAARPATARICACGCGQPIRAPMRRDARTLAVRFCHGHHRKGIQSPLKGRKRT